MRLAVQSTQGVPAEEPFMAFNFGGIRLKPYMRLIFFRNEEAIRFASNSLLPHGFGRYAAIHLASR
jgi:hypothetical protein